MSRKSKESHVGSSLRKLRITIVSPFLRKGTVGGAGGMARSAESLYNGLGAESLVEVRKTPQDYRFPLLFFARLVRNVMWADIIHVQIAGVIGALNVVLTVILAHGAKRVIVAYAGGYPEEFLTRFYRYLYLIFRRTKILVPTCSAANCFRRRGYDTWTIHNIIEVDSFLKTRREPGRDRLIVCRHLKRLYNIPMALHAFGKIKQQFPSATLTIVGDGSMRDELVHLSRQLGLEDVTFHPSIPHAQLPKMYAKADLLLNPTNAVEIPMSLVEAAAAGLLVVSIDQMGIREFIQHGINGFLVPADDSQMMANYAIRALKEPDLRSRLQETAKRSAAEYSWQKLRSRYYALYQNVSRETRRSAHSGQSARSWPEAHEMKRPFRISS
jgi:glycosyltransferase involved in cell wall biosynthesis